MSRVAVCRASPSLALLKYWGKAPTLGGRKAPTLGGRKAPTPVGRGEPAEALAAQNRPATPSLAVTLGGVSTETTVTEAERDEVYLDGVLQERERFAAFFERLRRTLGVSMHFRAESHNDFPSAAGLASSSSGFAALTAACVCLAGRTLPAGRLSDLARTGSASAARSVYGGFVLFPAGARSARPLYGEEHWPELRVLVAVVTRQAKPVSSREAMERTRATSPYYRPWLRSSAELLPRALEALRLRDLEHLGEVMLLSYARMHASILSADPPILYWLPATVAVIHECRSLRREGVGAWETIDAGPQVKICCLERDLEVVRARLRGVDPSIQFLECRPGPAPYCEVRES
ncbi:MAG: diphosphomevalonate decarboxylase [Spirochaetales bacterium]|nr:diphosphomevalonate decarboxylase [Spirochaetales bacterium]